MNNRTLGYICRASITVGQTNLERFRDIVPGLKINDALPCYYVGKTTDATKARRIRSHKSAYRELLCVTAGENFEDAVLNYFDHLRIIEESGSKSASYIYRHDDASKFVLYLLQNGHAVPDDSLADDLVAENTTKWLSGFGDLRADDRMSGLLDMSATTDERIDHIRTNFELESDSFILTDRYAALVRGSLDRPFGDAYSEAYFNQKVIHADVFFTKNNRAENNKWIKSMLVNSDTDGRELAWTLLAEKIDSGEVVEAIVYMKPDHVCNDYFHRTIRPLISMMYFSRGRAGLQHSYKLPRNGRRRKAPMVKERGVGIPKGNSSATAGHCFAYIGPNPNRFREVFERGDNGWCVMVPYPLPLVTIPPRIEVRSEVLEKV